MHLLLEQYAENAKWHQGKLGSMLGTVSNSGAFTKEQSKSVEGTLVKDSVVVIFLFPEPANNDADSIAAIIDKCKELDKDFKVWCHYGGDIAFSELSDRWATYDRLPTVGKSNPKQLLYDYFASRDVQYPYPFSSNFDLQWKPEIDTARGKMKSKQWPDSAELLDKAWNRAEKEISKFKTMREVCRATGLHINVNEISACLDNIPVKGSTIDHWRRLCDLAHSMGMGRSAPSHYHVSLSERYQSVANCIFTLYTSDADDFKGGVKVATTVDEIANLDRNRKALSDAIDAFRNSYSNFAQSRPTMGFCPVLQL